MTMNEKEGSQEKNEKPRNQARAGREPEKELPSLRFS